LSGLYFGTFDIFTALYEHDRMFSRKFARFLIGKYFVHCRVELPGNHFGDFIASMLLSGRRSVLRFNPGCMDDTG
tara:strand:- start:437 stop:661 length:225 start_codon:yes stop_codon:yes gene_type:complete